MTTAGQTTHETGRNVFVSHGLICSPSSTAVGDAIQSRSAAVTSMHSISSRLAGNLRTAAGDYDATDRSQHDGLDGQLR